MSVVPRRYVPAAGPATVGDVHASLAVALGGATKADRSPVHSAVTGGGQVMLGRVVSTTVMALLHEDELLDVSLAT